MATIMNKTSMRKFVKLYTIQGHEVTIVEAKALSNKVLYLQVEFPPDRFGGYTLDYVAENTKNAEVAKSLRYLGGFDELFLHEQEQDRRSKIEQNEYRYLSYIGKTLSELLMN